MAENVLMLALSPTMETGTIAKWTAKEGDAIDSGDVLCEVETDKAVMDYETIQEGVLLKIVLPEGGEARVGDTIAIIGEEGEDISSLLAEAQAAPSEAPSAPAETVVEEAPQAPAPEVPEQKPVQTIHIVKRLKSRVGFITILFYVMKSCYATCERQLAENSQLSCTLRPLKILQQCGVN